MIGGQSGSVIGILGRALVDQEQVSKGNVHGGIRNSASQVKGAVNLPK